MPTSVTVASIAGSKFEQSVKAGDHVLVGDEPLAVGGTDHGPTPYEFLLAALGT